jgi:outer membrane protein OmpA-like peptidoglycan-associated protein
VDPVEPVEPVEPEQLVTERPESGLPWDVYATPIAGRKFARLVRRGESLAFLPAFFQANSAPYPEAITFDVDSATVHPDYVDEIAFVAGNLRGNANSTVQVIGHTDDTGSTAHNQGLSERRADAVATILTANGVEAWRVSPSGVGYARPVASNDTPGGRAQNRRVEIVITPTGTAA